VRFGDVCLLTEEREDCCEAGTRRKTCLEADGDKNGTKKKKRDAGLLRDTTFIIEKQKMTRVPARA
jgi:hypothetical protein